MIAGLARFKGLKMQNCLHPVGAGYRMQKFYEFWKSNAARPEYFLVAAALIFTACAGANVIFYAAR
jgi:hypothetical protein